MDSRDRMIHEGALVPLKVQDNPNVVFPFLRDPNIVQECGWSNTWWNTDISPNEP